MTAASAERLARSLILDFETGLSGPLCLADLDDALARCDTAAERAAVAAATIRLYAVRPQPERTPPAGTRRDRRNGDRPRPPRPIPPPPVRPKGH